MAEFTVAGKKYKSRKLDAFKQFHIARRVSPIFSSLGAAFKVFEASKTPDAPNGNPLVVLEPVGESLSKIDDADAEYVLNACMGVCQVWQGDDRGNGIWADLMSPTGTMFPIDLGEMLQISWYVFQENLANFSASLPDDLLAR